MAVAQRRLGEQLRLLYEQDEPDPIAVVLGATSLDEAIDGLESISRTARATKGVVDQARSARTLIRSGSQQGARDPGAAPDARDARERSPHTAAGLEQAQRRARPPTSAGSAASSS